MAQRLATTLLVLPFLFGVVDAAPRDVDVPKPDPPGHWRVMHQTNEKSTSKCIGNPSTPLCAVETARACFVRDEPELCRIALKMDNFTWLKLSSRQPREYIHEKYRVYFSMQIRDGDIPNPEDGDWLGRGFKGKNVMPGDIVIDLDVRSCWRELRCDPLKHSVTWYYFVRKLTDRWVVVDYTGAY
jgi:hypothetical protein